MPLNSTRIMIAIRIKYIYVLESNPKMNAPPVGGG